MRTRVYCVVRCLFCLSATAESKVAFLPLAVATLEKPSGLVNIASELKAVVSTGEASALNLVDGNMTSEWVPDKDKGTGAWVLLRFPADKKRYINRIHLFDGAKKAQTTSFRLVINPGVHDEQTEYTIDSVEATPLSKEGQVSSV